MAEIPLSVWKSIMLPQKINRWLSYSLAVVAIAHLVTYLYVVWQRLAYPYELEWMEGAILQHVQRLQQGQPLYVKPSLSFVSLLYPPLYYYVGAWLSNLIGGEFLPLRLLSFLATSGSMGLIGLTVYHETRHKLASVMAGGLFVACFSMSDAWYDLARVDSLHLFLLLLAVYIVRFRPGYGLVGFVLGLAFLTKQTTLLPALALTVYVWWHNRRDGVLLLAVFMVVSVGGTLWLDGLHEGWYRYYVFTLPGRHGLVLTMLYRFWTVHLLPFVPIALLISVAYVWQTFRRDKQHFYAFLFITFMGTAWLSMLNQGSAGNGLFPAIAIISLLWGLGVAKGVSRPGFATPILLLSLLQFALLAYNPIPHIPTTDDEAAGDQLVAQISAIEGDIWLPFHPYLATRAGKPTYAHTVAIWDVIGQFGGDPDPISRQLTNDLQQAITTHHFAAIITDVPWNTVSLEPHYQAEPLPFSSEDIFWTRTGWRLRPTLFYRAHLWN